MGETYKRELKSPKHVYIHNTYRLLVCFIHCKTLSPFSITWIAAPATSSHQEQLREYNNVEHCTPLFQSSQKYVSFSTFYHRQSSDSHWQVPDQNEFTRFRKNLNHHHHDRIICILSYTCPVHTPLVTFVAQCSKPHLPTDGIFMYEAVCRICSRDAECCQGMGRTE